jgi:hypothetical protein
MSIDQSTTSTTEAIFLQELYKTIYKLWLGFNYSFKLIINQQGCNYRFDKRWNWYRKYFLKKFLVSRNTLKMSIVPFSKWVSIDERYRYFLNDFFQRGTGFETKNSSIQLLIEFFHFFVWLTNMKKTCSIAIVIENITIT